MSADGQVATRASGRWVSGGSEFVVTTNGTSITYRTLPPHSWVLRSPARAGVEVNGAVPSGSPLDVLKTPSQVTLTGQTGSTVDLTASYPAATLGLAGSGTVPVEITIATDRHPRRELQRPER